MSTVASCFGHSRPNQSTTPHPDLAFNAHVGIELEIEECSHLDIEYWDCKEDGSLRNGCEMVCAAPYAGETLYAAIEALAKGVGESDAQGTWRCSTHVHLDVRDLNAATLQKVILAYAFYEKVLFKCSGFHRYRSNFCPAFAVVQQQIFNVSSAFNSNGDRFFNQLIRGWDKYTSLNLLPLRDFGSVEFRISEPKWKRTNVLNLVNRYLVLKKVAVENASMNNSQFLEHLRLVGFEPMLPYLPFDYNPDPDDLDLGWLVANDIISTRNSDVQFVPRVRDNAFDQEGSIMVPLRELGHWNAYMQHTYAIARNWSSRNLADLCGSNWTDCSELTELSEATLRAIISELRNASGERVDRNITSLIPDGIEGDLSSWLSAN